MTGLFTYVKQKDVYVNPTTPWTGYVTQKKFKEVCGEHFNLPGHSIADMVVVGIERVLPRGDKLIRTIKEAYWINQYESCTFGANRQE